MITTEKTIQEAGIVVRRLQANTTRVIGTYGLDNYLAVLEANGFVEYTLTQDVLDYLLANNMVEKNGSVYTLPTPKKEVNNDYVIEWSEENDIRKAFVEMMRNINEGQEVGYDDAKCKTYYYESLNDDEVLEYEKYSINDEYHEAFLGGVGEYLEKNCKVVAERYFNFTQEISSIEFYKDNKWLFTVSYKSEVGDSYVIKTPTLEVTFDDNHEYSQIDDFLTLLYTANITVKHK